MSTMEWAGVWPWATLAALGAFHGVNPAMGWLFAVALGLQQRSRAAVVRSLVPIAIGHAASIALVVAAFVALSAWFDGRWLRIAAAALLLGMAAYRFMRRHTGRAGMRVGFRDLVMWSFLMATGHGAGLMLLPVLMPSTAGTAHSHHMDHGVAAGVGDSLPIAITAVAVHTLATLAVAGAIALVVYEWFGLAFLRRGWINLDAIWSFALAAAGIILLIPLVL